MRTRSVRLGALALALASLACQPPAQVAAGLSEVDLAAIEATWESFGEAALAGDWATFVAFYAEDAVFMPPNEPAFEGRAAIRAWHEALPTGTQIIASPVEIDGRGNLAYMRGTYASTFTVAAMAEPISDSGKYVVIFRKQADGAWLIAVDIFNSDLPLPEEGSGT